MQIVLNYEINAEYGSHCFRRNGRFSELDRNWTEFDIKRKGKR
jgi:hypothetical protein